MAYSSCLKRTFQELTDRIHTTEQEDLMAFRVPFKRKKLQTSLHDFSSELGQAVPLGFGPDIKLDLLHIKKQGCDELALEPALTATTSCSSTTPEKFSTNTDLDLTRFRLVSQLESASLNLNNALVPAHPGNTLGVQTSLEDPTSFEKRLLFSQMFPHHSMQKQLPIFNSPRYLWPRTNSSTENIIFSDLRRCLLDRPVSKTIGRSSDGPRKIFSDCHEGAERSVTGDEVCTECQKVFKRKVYLQRHMEREHWLPAKVFKCEDCKYETKHQSNLSVHRRTHTGERPYHCGACGQRYTQGHLLKSHIRSRHAGNLRFYNLDKRGDSTRGRKSLDFKHDIYLCLQSQKANNELKAFITGTEPPPQSPLDRIQNSGFFIQQQRRLSSYLPGLPISALCSTQRWIVPPKLEMKEEWVSGKTHQASSSSLALDVFRQRCLPSNDMSILPTAAGMAFLHTPMDVSTSQLGTVQSVSHDRNHPDGNAGVLSIKETGRAMEGDFAEDLSADRKTSTHGHQEPPIPAYPEDITRTESNEETDGTTCSTCLPDGQFHVSFQENQAEKSKKKAEEDRTIDDRNVSFKITHDFFPQEHLTTCQNRSHSIMKEQAPMEYSESNADLPTDLSKGQRDSTVCDVPLVDPVPHPTTTITERCCQSNSSNDTALDENLGNEQDTSYSCSAINQTELEPNDELLPVKTDEGGGLESAICPHFRKLQKFRRIVFRFVNAFAPNSVCLSDDRFAETDLIDEIVHAAMFNDFD